MHIMTDKEIYVLLYFLKNKECITELEKDLLDTYNEYIKSPFDRESADKKITGNIFKYPKVFLSDSAISKIIVKPSSHITDDELKYNLSQQIELLSIEELEALNNELK